MRARLTRHGRRLSRRSAWQVCAADNIQKLGSGTGVGAKVAEQLTRDHRYARFMDSPRRHTLMYAFDDHADAFGFEYVLNTVSDLRRHGLLNLQTPGECFDNPCQLADTDDFSVRQIADMNFAYDWCHVVFTMRLEADLSLIHI